MLAGGWPWIGHALTFHRAPVDLLRKGRERHGEIFSIRLAGRRVTVLSGPSANGAFFKAPDDQLSAKEAYQFTVPIFGRGIAYDASPEVMAEQLALLFPALRDERLQAYAGFMEEEARRYFEAWGEAGEADILDAANDLTVFIASRCLIGREFRERLSGEFARLYGELEEGLNLIGFLKPNFPLPSFRRRDRARVQMVERISSVIAERRASGIEGEDFLSTLMAARYSDGRALTEDEITGLLLTMIFAGQHTSAVLAAWTGLLLLENPAFLPPILDEQEEVFGQGEDMSLERLRRLVLLERAIKEAERMRPPLVMLMRAVRRELDYGGFTLAPGELAMVSPAVTHRLPEVFAEPDRYDPDRFSPGRAEDRKALYSLIGFGGGKHRCIGLTFAYQQIKVIWSVLLREFDLELVLPRHEPDYDTFVVGPRQPCLIRYRRRRSLRRSVRASAAG
jgi:sterol 14-demethylase